jgi:hypothetical protein
MSSKKNEKPEAKIKVTTRTQMPCGILSAREFLEITIAGADGPTRSKVSTAIKKAVDSLADTAPKPKKRKPARASQV